MSTLDSKVALVTGGSRGIGEAIVRRLSADGAAVAFSYSSSSTAADVLVDELRAAGGTVSAYRADQGSPSDVEGLVRQAVDDFGQLDILVNNAGTAVFGSLTHPDTDMDSLDRQLAVNVAGVIRTVRAVSKVISRGGRIVSIGSTAASYIGNPGIADYAGTKAAVSALSRGWAHDLGDKQVTVNTIHPGPTDVGQGPAEEVAANIILGRLGKPSEVAGLVAYLVGPEAGYITGADITIDGGYSV
ncbi:3-oxoacyl-[acyl-carrier protein] reductase [Promicromonospora sp. AC04]|nr:3-oxoacyl-[acyl-carrier protein] reductase [Promicromonospora sp. AC04]